MARWMFSGIIIVIIIGYAMFTSDSTLDAEIISIYENIFDDGITTYYVDNRPTLPGDTSQPTREAFDEWIKLNPDLVFEQVYSTDSADINIHWEKVVYLDGVYATGVTEFVAKNFDITIDYGGDDCNGDTIPYTNEMIKNVLKHEIGHVLGLDHSSSIDHLMYDVVDGTDDFDNLGYVIPDSIEYDYFIGEEELFDELDSIPYRTNRSDQIEKELDCINAAVEK